MRVIRMLFCTCYLMSGKPVEPFLWGFSPPTPRIRKQWFTNSERAREKRCSSEFSTFLLKGSNSLQNPDCIKSEPNSDLAGCILVFLMDTVLEVTSLLLVYMEVHTWPGWIPQTDLEESQQAVGDELIQSVTWLSVESPQPPDRKLRSLLLFWGNKHRASHIGNLHSLFQLIKRTPTHSLMAWRLFTYI